MFHYILHNHSCIGMGKQCLQEKNKVMDTMVGKLKYQVLIKIFFEISTVTKTFVY